MADKEERDLWNDKYFDFTGKIFPIKNVSITKDNIGGIFPAGVIQYVITYYNSNSKESPIIYISPLLYLTGYDKGEAADSSVNCRFNININIDKVNYEYLRLYSIIRTSLNAVPTVSIVKDVKLSEYKQEDDTYSIKIIDTNQNVSTIDPTELFYKSNISISAESIVDKDNTLFLGGVKLLTDINDKYQQIKNYIQSQISLNVESIKVSVNSNTSRFDSDWYKYNFLLDQNVDNNIYPIKTLKFKETYRLGIRCQLDTGEWLDPIFIRDYKMEYPQNDVNSRIYPAIRITNLVDTLKSFGVINVMPLIVFPTDANRERLYQGIACPTVYNAQDRLDNSPFVQASWFFRPCAMGDTVGTRNELEIGLPNNTPFSCLKYLDLSYDYDGSVSISGNIQSYFKFKEYSDIDNLITKVEFPPITSIKDNTQEGSVAHPWSNIRLTSTIIKDSKVRIAGNQVTELIKDFNKYKSALYYIDPTIITINSPDMDYSDSQYTFNENDSIEVIGFAVLDANYCQLKSSSKFNNLGKTSYQCKQVKGIFDIPISGWSGRRPISPFNMLTTRADFISYTNNTRDMNYPIFTFGGNFDTNTRSYLLYSSKTYYKQNSISYALACSDIKTFDSDTVSALSLSRRNFETHSNIYYGNIDKLISPLNQVCLINRSTPTSNYPDAGTNGVKLLESERYFAAYQNKSPFSIKYKSSKHIIASLNDISANTYWAFPNRLIVKDDSLSFISEVPTLATNEKLFWDGDISSPEKTMNVKGYSLPIKNEELKTICLNDMANCLPIVEVCRNVTNKFGGTSDSEIKNNLWEQAGPILNLDYGIASLKFMYGDTYYQRYDCLKTYPFNDGDQNSINEVASVMIETRVNLDGRTDNNRGRLTFFGLTPDTFSQINPVYNQSNNFFTYRVINDDSMVTNFPNTITWSKTKTLGEKIDTWTNITMASTLDLDGDKGKLRALRKWNNEIIAFQDKGISNILYNSRTQLAGTDGVPIELANSGKVDGKRYLSNIIGCNNKWSIRETPKGLYFIDGYNKGIYLFNGQFNNLSDSLGFNSWASDILSDPDNNNFFTCYDNSVQDVLFINDNLCLAFNETLNQFTSFYQYEGTKWLFNFNGNNLAVGYKLNTGVEEDSLYTLYKLREGSTNEDTNKFLLEVAKPSYVSIIVNQDPLKDKIFNSVEYRGIGKDFENNEINPFTKVNIENDYQSGSSRLNVLNRLPSNTKRKFRIWRSLLPRDTEYPLDRIRSPWAKITLSTSSYNDISNEILDLNIQDIVVKYFE